jgi:WD domain, G-beta repeat
LYFLSPEYHLDDEYEDARQAQRDKRIVEFNRSLLINGFRRLEALERKRDYESLTGTMRSVVHKRANKEAGGGDADAVETAESASLYPPPPGTIVAADPLEPTIHLTTLCAATSTPTGGGSGAAISRPLTDAAAIWDEPGVGICCAKICPPDGRRFAAGCDDSAIRIWNLAQSSGNSGTTGEPCEVLLGHKNGFPVFDVAWNRDGRALLSAGGDGSIRLWDTMAVGPFGEVSTPVPTPSSSGRPTGSKSSAVSKAVSARNAASSTTADNNARGPDMSVRGL